MSGATAPERSARTQTYPVVEAPIVAPPPSGGGAVRAAADWLGSVVGKLGGRAGLIGVVGVAVAIAVLALAGVFGSLFSGGRQSLGPPPGIVVVGSSWVTGEPSLATNPQFAAIETRAAALAQARWTARLDLIAEIAAAKKAAAARRRADLLRKYEEERARELAAYRAKLREIQKIRAEELAKERAAKLKYERELAAYLKARTVTPGQECHDPLVSQYYSCQNGLLPAGHHRGH